MQELVAILKVNALSDAHFNHQRRHVLRDERLRERAVTDSSGFVYPHHIGIEQLCVFYKIVSIFGTNAHLRYLADKNVAGVYVNAHIRAFDVFDELFCDIFGDRADIRPREHTVHIQSRHRERSRYRLHAERIYRRIYFDRACKVRHICSDLLHELIADILPFKLVAVNTRDYRDTLSVFRVHAAEGILFYRKLFVDVQLYGDYIFYHRYLISPLNCKLKFTSAAPLK